MVNWTSEEGSAGKGLGAGEGRQGEAKVEKMVEAKVPAKCQRSGSQKKKIIIVIIPLARQRRSRLTIPTFAPTLSAQFLSSSLNHQHVVCE